MNERRRSGRLSTSQRACFACGPGWAWPSRLEHLLLTGLGIPFASSAAFSEHRRHSMAACVSVCLCEYWTSNHQHLHASTYPRPTYVQISDVSVFAFIIVTRLLSRKLQCTHHHYRHVPCN